MELLAALSGGVATLLWIIAAVLVIAGIVWIIRGGVLAGIVVRDALADAVVQQILAKSDGAT